MNIMLQRFEKGVSGFHPFAPSLLTRPSPSLPCTEGILTAAWCSSRVRAAFTFSNLLPILLCR